MNTPLTIAASASCVSTEPMTVASDKDGGLFGGADDCSRDACGSYLADLGVVDGCCEDAGSTDLGLLPCLGVPSG